MIEISAQANSCEDCPMKKYTTHWICSLTKKWILPNIADNTFHPDCPMVEIKEREV